MEVTGIKETLAYVKIYNSEIITTIKIFIVQAPDSKSTKDLNYKAFTAAIKKCIVIR
jgi:hypothetical protein